MSRRAANSSIGGDAITLTASKVITLVVNMLTSMLLVRYCSIEEYGTYSQLLLTVNLVSSLVILGLPNSINYFYARAETVEEKQKFLSVYYTLNTLLSIIMGVALFLSIPFIESYFHNSEIKYFFYFLALYPWASVSCSSIENILVVCQKVRYLTLYRTLYSIVMLGSVMLVQWLNCEFSIYMKCFVGINCIFAASVYWIVSNISGGLSICFDKVLIKTIFQFSLPMGLATAVGTLNSEIDKLLIGYLMDTETLAIYTNAAKELPLTIVASSITAVLLPQMTRLIKDKKTEQAVQIWGYAIELALLTIGVIVAGVFVYAEDVMTVLYSEKYLSGVLVFRVYTLNLILRCTYFGIVLNAYGETKKILYCSIGSLVLNAILNPICYWLFGMVGPAIATFMAIFLIMLLQLVMTVKVAHIKFRNLFPWKRFLNIFVINVGFAICFWQIKKLCPIDMYIGNVVESIVLGSVWIAIYAVIMKKKFIYAWNKLNQKEKGI